MAYMTNFGQQKHLTKREMINLGSYYTKPHLVDMAYKLICSNVENINDWTILDSSCGYGSFFDNEKIKGNKKIGADIDKEALENAKLNIQKLNTVYHNSLMSLSRADYKISENENLIIVGNPPYNDITSIIRNDIKSETKHNIHPKFKTRDLGISFLRSYAELNPDFICILHPLSYLIKKANFDLLESFSTRYKLIDSIIISSEEFNGTAPGKTYFPIIIALYRRHKEGMKHSDIERFLFITKEGKKFSLNNMISIKNFLSKYPNQKWVNQNDAVAKFWTMRDINALKRSKTFVNEITDNTILVQKHKLPYYCYVDIFKQYIEHIPYYLGNCDVFIDQDKFEPIKEYFVAMSAKNRPELQKYISYRVGKPEIKINDYFRNLLGKHYVEIK